MSSAPVRAVVIVPVTLVALSFIVSPFLMPEGAVTGLDGTPLIMDYRHIWSELDPIPAISYGFGDILCHQESERSLTLNGSQMPVCVRDMSIILGFLSCFIGLSVRGIGMGRRTVATLLVFATLLMVLDHTVQMILVLNVPMTRVVTGLMFGASVATALDAWIRFNERLPDTQLY